MKTLIFFNDAKHKKENPLLLCIFLRVLTYITYKYSYIFSPRNVLRQKVSKIMNVIKPLRRDECTFSEYVLSFHFLTEFKNVCQKSENIL